VRSPVSSATILPHASFTKAQRTSTNASRKISLRRKRTWRRSETFWRRRERSTVLWLRRDRRADLYTRIGVALPGLPITRRRPLLDGRDDGSKVGHGAARTARLPDLILPGDTHGLVGLGGKCPTALLASAKAYSSSIPTTTSTLPSGPVICSGP